MKLLSSLCKLSVRVQLTSLYSRVVFAIVLFGVNSVSGQSNLVLNGDFEQHATCPTDADQFYLAVGWDTLRAGGGGAPEYLNRCSPSSAYSIPANIYGYQPPSSGDGYVALFCYYDWADIPLKREYLQGKLSDTLDSGKSYCITFYISHSFAYSQFAIDRMGAYLDDGSISTSYYGQATVTPQIETSSIADGGTYLSDTLNWMKIQGSFVSSGIEEYITLGNFQDYNHTSAIESGGCWECGTYYLIDDVSVIEINTQANAGPDQTLYIGDSVFIGIPEIGDEFTWYANGVPFYTGSEAGLWVTPEETTTYVCEQHVCNVVTRDTVVVTVEGIGLQNQNQNENQNEELKLYPNPSSGVVYLKAQYPSANGYEVKIADAAGRILDEQLVSGNGQIILPEENGVYFLSITDLDGNVTITQKVQVLR